MDKKNGEINFKTRDIKEQWLDWLFENSKILIRKTNNRHRGILN